MTEVVAVAIEGKRFANWHSLSLTFGLDVVATIALSAPFEPDRLEFRELFRPFAFTPITVEVGGARQFTGTMVDVAPNFDAESTEVEVSGYALPGVLGDCDPPASALPFEWKDVGLKTIAESVCAPFGLGVDFRLTEDPPFEKVALDPFEEIKKGRGSKAIDESGKPWEFLGKLTKQRNAVLSSTADGKLLIWQAGADAPSRPSKADFLRSSPSRRASSLRSTIRRSPGFRPRSEVTKAESGRSRIRGWRVGFARSHSGAMTAKTPTDRSQRVRN